MGAAIRNGRCVVRGGAVSSARFFAACRCGVVGVHGSRYGFDRAFRLFAEAALRTVEEAADRQTAGSPLEPLEQCGVRRFFSLFCSFGYCSVFSVDNISECDGRMSPENDVLPFSILFFVRGRIKARLRFQRLRFSSRSFCNSYMRSRYFAAARKSSDLAARSISSFAFAISVSRFSPAM